MKLKYTGLYESILVKEPGMGIDYLFKRNKWKDIDDKHAEYLKKTWYFLSEDDFIFDHSKLKTEESLHIAIDRFGALGDLIQFLPVIREIKRLFPQHKYYLITGSQYHDIFKPIPDLFEDIIDPAMVDHYRFQKRISIDGVLEADHSLTNHEAKQHRVHILEDFFKVKCQKYDFSMYYQESDKKYVEAIINAFI